MLKKSILMMALALCSVQAQAKPDKSAPVAATVARPCFHLVLSKGKPLALNLSQVLFMDINAGAEKGVFILNIHVPAARYDPQPYLVFNSEEAAATALRALMEAASVCR
jgi:hypothetical protein